MICKNLFLLNMGLLLIFNASPCFSDGMFMSSEQLHLHSPGQKAIVTWDGKTEQMLLSSRVQADKISDMVWIIPIQSRIKPDVQKGDFSIFKKLISYFGRKVKNPNAFEFDLATGKDATKGVEVIETKTVDIYDIAILKATSTQDLLQWLNANGYQVSEDAKPIIKKYIQQPSMYFVANKIALRNKFNTDIKQTQDFYESMKQHLEEKQQMIGKRLNNLLDAQISNCSTWNTIENGLAREKEFSSCMIEKVKMHFQQMGRAVETISPDLHFLNTSIFSIDDHWTVTFVDFNRLSDSYFVLRYNNRIVLTDMFPRKQDRYLDEAKYFSHEIGQKAIMYADMIRMILAKGLVFKKDLDKRSKDIKTKRKDVFMILSTLSKWNQGLFFCKFRYFKNNFPDGDRHNIILEAASGILPNSEIGKTNYCQTIFALQEGMATPLKIIFEPDTPYYPLEISSLAKGTSMIDVYVIANGGVSDQNKIFQEVEPLKLSKALKGKIIKEFQSGPWEYATRLTWRGRLSDLKKDAVFILH